MASPFSYSLTGLLTCRKLGREVAVLEPVPFGVDRDRVDMVDRAEERGEQEGGEKGMGG